MEDGKNERRDQYYPDGDTETQRRKPNFYLFRPEELDDDEVIIAVENTPTYERTKQRVREIRQMTIDVEAPVEQKPATADSGDGIIRFV